MVTINGVSSILGTAICIGIFLIPIMITIFFGIQSRIKFAEQIRQNYADNIYKDWNKPPTSTRLRALVLSQLFLLLGFIIWFITGFVEPSSMFSRPRLIIFATMFILIFTIGIVLQRMVAKGK